MPSRPAVPGTAAVVLCGGTSRRLGGRDKTAVRLRAGGGSVLDELLADLPADWPVVCVGPPRRLGRVVSWTREDPPGGGPLAGMQAGLRALDGAPGGSPAADIVVVLAGDQPFAGAAAGRLAGTLRDSPASVDAVAARREGGQDAPQLLLAAYRTSRLAARLTGTLEGRGVHRALAGLRVRLETVTGRALLDVDTPRDLAEARRAATPLGSAHAGDDDPPAR